MKTIDQEIKEYIQIHRQLIYLTFLKSFFIDLTEINEEKKDKLDAHISSYFFRIFEKQKTIYLASFSGNNNFDKEFFENNILSALLLKNQSSLFDHSYNIEQFIHKDELYAVHINEPSLFQNKIGRSEFDSILKEMINSSYIRKSLYTYQDKVKNLCKKYEINTENFRYAFPKNDRYGSLLELKGLAFYNEKNDYDSYTKLNSNSAGGALVCEFLYSSLIDKRRELIKNNKFLYSLEFSIHYDKCRDLVDWENIINGKDFYLLKEILNSNVSEEQLFSTVTKHINVFECHKDWIIDCVNETKKTERLKLDIVKILDKCLLENSLQNSLQQKKVSYILGKI